MVFSIVLCQLFKSICFKYFMLWYLINSHSGHSNLKIAFLLTWNNLFIIYDIFGLNLTLSDIDMVTLFIAPPDIAAISLTFHFLYFFCLKLLLVSNIGFYSHFFLKGSNSCVCIFACLSYFLKISGTFFALLLPASKTTSQHSSITHCLST